MKPALLLLIGMLRRQPEAGWGSRPRADADVIIRNNVIWRSGNIGVFISTSKNAQIYSNTIDSNFRGILYYVNCTAVGGGAIGFDLANNSAHGNTIIVSSQSGAFANGFSYSSACSSTQAAPYMNGSKNLTFTRNSYSVPSLGGWYWLFWDSVKYWGQWQSLGLDVEGAIQ